MYYLFRISPMFALLALIAVVLFALACFAIPPRWRPRALGAVLMALLLPSCATTTVTRTDAKGATVTTETKSFDTGVGSLASQLITGLTGAKPPKAKPAPATVQPMPPATAPVVAATK